MKLSGWLRVWIVSAVIMWGGGFWFLSQIEYQGYYGGWYEIDHRMPPILPNNPEALRFCRGATGATGISGWDEAASKPTIGCQAQIDKDWRRFWEEWSVESSKAGHLPAVLLAPFLLGGLMLALAWIARGFRRREDTGAR